MSTAQISKIIAAAIEHESRTAAFANLLHQLSVQQTGKCGDEAAVAATVEVLTAYIHHVPAVLESASKAANEAGVQSDVQPMLDAVALYFVSPLDLIPDHHGLAGLLDDAYLAHSVLQGLSEKYQAQSGMAFLPIDMSQVNAVVRLVIGEPVASQLDMAVAATLNLQAIQNALTGLMAFGRFGGGSFIRNDPIWGNASVNEIVSARLGALGIV
jgi:uncharacterized membrane protein YkvA (DUF1232 family)